MLRKPPRRSRILLVVTALAVIALFQIYRHGRQADNEVSGLATSRACDATDTRLKPASASSAASKSASVVLQLDYAGALAVVNALERDSLSDADVDSLLRIHGVCTMVDNVRRFFPGHGVEEFRKDIRSFVRTKEGGDADRYFRLSTVWQARGKVRSLVAAIQANERQIAQQTISRLERYRPSTGALPVTAYFVAGGVSDGFAFEDDPTSFYANLATANGDLSGVVLNMAHEAYHVMQFRAQERSGVAPRSASGDTMSPIGRLFATTLTEGTANYVVDPTRWDGSGAAIDSARERYQRNVEPARIARNFALFDSVLSALRDHHMTWEKAYRSGFTNENDASFYFVGYEMARAIEQHCGRDCIGQLFKEPAVEFFRGYVALYRKHPEITGRFSPATEATIAGFGAKSTK